MEEKINRRDGTYTREKANTMSKLAKWVKEMDVILCVISVLTISVLIVVSNNLNSRVRLLEYENQVLKEIIENYRTEYDEEDTVQPTPGLRFDGGF